jgi:tetratricopeptide (TPR) repeat protein
MKKTIWCISAGLVLLAFVVSGCLAPGKRWVSGSTPEETAQPDPVAMEAVNPEDSRDRATQIQAKAVTEQQLKQSHWVRIREFLEEADEKRLAVLLGQAEVTDEILVETDQEEGWDVRACSILGEVYTRGGEMEHCKAYNLYRFTDRGALIGQAKKLYNQALDMDPNNVQALIGLANLYIIQAVDAQYRRDRLRLNLEKLLVNLKPKGKVTGDPLDLSFTEVIAKIRPASNPTKDEKRRIREFLWAGTNNRNLIDSYLRASRARCEDALRVNSQFAPAHLGLAVVAAVENKWKVALAKLTFLEENKLDIRRNRSMFYVWKGFVLERMGNADDALKAYRLAIELDEPYQFMDFPRERVRAILLSQKPR